jgi:hypothetical protein
MAGQIMTMRKDRQVVLIESPEGRGKVVQYVSQQYPLNECGTKF